MARVSTYLNFARTTEAAFTFYKSVFGTEFLMPVVRYKDIPAQPGQALAEGDQNLVMHVELPILAGHVLMGTDVTESMGYPLKPGNNVHINLEPNTRSETRRLFELLSDGGKVDMPLEEMFWGGYYGSLSDRFGIRWMFNCNAKS